MIERHVNANDRDLLNDRLRDQEPVEGIFVARWKRHQGHLTRINQFDGQKPEPITIETHINKISIDR